MKVQFSVHSERYRSNEADVCLSHMLDLRDLAKVSGVDLGFDARTTDQAEGSVDCAVCDDGDRFTREREKIAAVLDHVTRHDR